jgi:outer membrane protein
MITTKNSVSTYLRMVVMTAVLAVAIGASAGQVEFNLTGAPAEGAVFVYLFDSANAFGDFRDPARLVTHDLADGDLVVLADIPAGDYAVMLHFDENGNGVFDKNFIGIPTEPIAFSNNYEPKGPPTWNLARFTVAEGETVRFNAALFKALGERGRLGVGLGVIGRGSPYRDYDGGVYQPIPAVTYNGERFQALGPIFRYGLAGSDLVRLAATASFRIGVYDEDDSPFLEGMGDRENTLMAGLALQIELPRGFDLALQYEHDVLDQIGGGQAQLRLDKSFQAGLSRISPYVSINWLSADLADHDFGVAPDVASVDRPAYAVGDIVTTEVGVGTFIELSRDWRLLINAGVEFFPGEVTDSPIVDEDQVIKGFTALNYVF